MTNFLGLGDLNKAELIDLVALAERVKQNRSERSDLKGKNIALIFEKPSLRTRLSFEIAVKELSGNYYYLGQEVGFGKREAIKDIAHVLSRYVQGCIIRTFKQEDLLNFSEYSSIPVINALTDLEHPSQVASDLLTIKEKIGRISDFKLAFIGDGNNVCHSLIQAASILGFDLSIAAPPGYEPQPDILKPALEKVKENGAKIEVLNNPREALKGADFIYTDVWTSMGQENEKEQRRKIFSAFQINKKLLKQLNKKYYIMHCLPAHRGEEITDEVIDSENSIVIDQAENRLHMHKAILIKLFSQI